MSFLDKKDSNFSRKEKFLIKNVGNLVIYRSVVGARLGHGWGTKMKFRGHGWGKHAWGKDGARLEHKTGIPVAWLGQVLGTVGAQN